MANYRKVTRDALVAALSDGTNGFNAQLGSIGQTYGIQPFALEFSADSKNVVYGYLDDEEVDVSSIFEFPGAVIYTTEGVDENRPNRSKYFVAGVISLYLRFSQLDAPDTQSNLPDFSNDFEKWPDACEDAMSAALYAGRGAMATEGVNFTNYRADRSPVVNNGDGHTQKLTFTLGFEVHI